MIRRRAWTLLGVLVGCGPGAELVATDEGGSSSSAAMAASSEGEVAGTTGPIACRQLPPELDARWSSVIDPDISTGGGELRATADGGAVVMSAASMVRLDHAGVPRSVQWFGTLSPTAFAVGQGDDVWVAGRDTDLVVARYDDAGELARGSRPVVDDVEQAFDMLPEADGVVILSAGGGIRVERVDAAMTFGPALTIAEPDGFSSAQLHAGGPITLTALAGGVASLTAVDSSGATMWQTELPVLDGVEIPMMTTHAAIGEVVYVAADVVDLADGAESTSWLVGLGLDEGGIAFASTTTPGPIASSACGTLYRVEARAPDEGAPSIVLVEIDATGAAIHEGELAVPTPPSGFAPGGVTAIAVSADGTVIVSGVHTDGTGATLAWIAAY